MDITAQDNKQLVVGAIDSAKAGNIEGFLNVMHPEVVVHEPDHLPYGGTYHGRESLLEVVQKAAALVDLETLELTAVTADEERAVLLLKFQLLGTGEEMIGTEHWVIEDGLVRDVRVFWYGLPPGR
jgi:hypothetical protein